MLCFVICSFVMSGDEALNKCQKDHGHLLDIARDRHIIWQLIHYFEKVNRYEDLSAFVTMEVSSHLRHM